jgi:uncharacterized protein (TIGR02231 family)
MQQLTFVLLFISTSLFAQQQKNSIQVNTQLTDANVYYGYGAELLHKGKASIGIGQYEVVLNNISTTLDQKTVQIACPENVVLLSYKYNTKVDNTPPPPNPLYKKMEDSIKAFQKQIAANTQEQTVTEELLTKTSKIVDGYTALPEKTINTADILKLIEFYNGKIQLYRNSVYALKIKSTDIQEQISEIYSRMSDLKRKDGVYSAKYSGQLILQVLTKEATTADIAVSYYTQRAGWVPTYDMRVKTIDNSFKLVYKASVSQTTGLDWKQTKLTLSTNNPNLGTNIPVLNPWNLQLYVPGVYADMQKGRAVAAANTYNRAQSMQVDEVVVRGYDAKKESYTGSVKSITASDISSYTTLNESQLFTSFEIDLPYDIPSDGTGYSVTIKDEKINATYKHYGIPKLDKDAFLLAEISNWESLDLLPGEANIIMDNVFLGKSFIDPNTTMDTLNLSLGRDRRVAIKRLLIKENSKTRFIGSNKIETFTYEITVKNNKKEVVNMILKDQFPISKTKEIEVTLDDNGNAEVNEELASVNWKISLQPGEQKKYRFTYSVKYAKDKKIVNLR